MPRHPIPHRGAPGRRAPGRGASVRGAPGRGASGRGAPGRVASDRVRSESSARTYHGERGTYEEGLHDYYQHNHSYHGSYNHHQDTYDQPVHTSFPRDEHHTSTAASPSSSVGASRLGDTHLNDGIDVIQLGSSERGRSNSTPQVRVPVHPHRPYIAVDIESGEFMHINHSAVVRDIVEILKSMFRGPWTRWKEVDTDSRETLWDRFRQTYRWDDGSDGVIHQAWEKVLSRRFTDILREMRKEPKKRPRHMVSWVCLTITPILCPSPPWIKQDYWSHMIYETWNTPEWQAMSKRAKTNRSSEVEGCVAKHCGGSISNGEHRNRMSKELGRDVRIDEVFRRTHTSKASREAEASGSGSAQFVDPRAERIYNEYKARVVDEYGPDASSQPVGDYRLWKEVTRGLSKGRVYGQRILSLWSPVHAVHVVPVDRSLLVDHLRR